MNKRKRLIKKNHFAVLTNDITACLYAAVPAPEYSCRCPMVWELRTDYSYTLPIITQIRGKYNDFCKSFY